MRPLLGAWLVAALVAAALAHALIGVAGTFAGGDADAYDARDHVVLIPVVVAALALILAFAGWIAAVVAARRAHGDPVAFLARRFAGVPPAHALFAVSGGAFATLLAMEFSEQLVAVGHVEGVADALGGSPLLGGLLVLVAASAVTLLGLRTAAGFVAAAAAVTLIVLRTLRRGRRLAAAVRPRRGDGAGPRCWTGITVCAHGVRGPPAAA